MLVLTATKTKSSWSHQETHAALTNTCENVIQVLFFYSTADKIILKYHMGVLTSTLHSRTWCITGSWKRSIGVEAKLHELWSAADLWTELKHFFLSYSVRRKWTRSAVIEGNSSSWYLTFWSDAGRVLILILRQSLSELAGWECQTPENTAWLCPT